MIRGSSIALATILAAAPITSRTVDRTPFPADIEGIMERISDVLNMDCAVPNVTHAFPEGLPYLPPEKRVQFYLSPGSANADTIYLHPGNFRLDMVDTLVHEGTHTCILSRYTFPPPETIEDEIWQGIFHEGIAQNTAVAAGREIPILPRGRWPTKQTDYWNDVLSLWRPTPVIDHRIVAAIGYHFIKPIIDTPGGIDHVFHNPPETPYGLLGYQREVLEALR